MTVIVSERLQEKIKKYKDGNAILATLVSFSSRENNRYTRGIVHGYLLALTTQGIISDDDALEILEPIER